jgi:hypothetical protein
MSAINCTVSAGITASNFAEQRYVQIIIVVAVVLTVTTSYFITGSKLHSKHCRDEQSELGLS